MIRRLIGLAQQVSYRQLLRNPRMEIGRIMGWIARRMGRVADVAAHGAPQMPDWLQQETFALAHIEPMLLSAHEDLRQYQHYGIPIVARPGELYREVLNLVGSGNFTHVMVLPWLVPGGADRGALHHLQAWSEQISPANILVLTTEPAASPWANRVPDGIRVVEFGRIVGEMVFEAQVQLLTRLLLQMQPEVVHNINSRLCWSAIKACGLALRQKSRIYASLFCDDYVRDMIPVGHARNFLRDCATHVETVFCDNSVYPVIWTEELGVPRKLFTVLPFPYGGDVVASPRASFAAPEGRPRVLWAGRLDRQKRPDLLLAIAKAMPHWDFDVHGRVVLGGEEQTLRELAALPNVTLHGEFAHLSEVILSSHIAYLHTAAWEGMPTILMDVAAAGLTIVAPAIGGIVDFVPVESLVMEVDNVEGYVRQLESLLAQAGVRDERVRSQDERMRADRTWSAFMSKLASCPGYLPDARAEGLQS